MIILLSWQLLLHKRISPEIKMGRIETFCIFNNILSTFIIKERPLLKTSYFFEEMKYIDICFLTRETVYFMTVSVFFVRSIYAFSSYIFICRDQCSCLLSLKEGSLGLLMVEEAIKAYQVGVPWINTAILLIVYSTLLSCCF